MHSANRVRFQAFYTKFYIPDKDLYPQEVENTDKLSRALVVSVDNQRRPCVHFVFLIGLLRGCDSSVDEPCSPENGHIMHHRYHPFVNSAQLCDGGFDRATEELEPSARKSSPGHQRPQRVLPGRTRTER